MAVIVRRSPRRAYRWLRRAIPEERKRLDQLLDTRD